MPFAEKRKSHANMFSPLKKGVSGLAKRLSMAANDDVSAFLKQMKAAESEFQSRHSKRIDELLEICKRYQGEYRFTHHGPGSWATTYSSEFINASIELYDILGSSKMYNPIWEMSTLFRKHGIRSCRGAEMFFDRVEYLYESHLRGKVKEPACKT